MNNLQAVSVQRFFIGAGALIAATSIVNAGDIELESFHVGAFYALTDSGDALIPDNDMSFQNYFMGHTTVGGFTTTERRTFFSFDLTSIVIPDGEVVTGVSFDLMLPFAGILANFEGGTEEVSFTSTTSDYLTFADPLGSGMGPDEIFDSMGTGEFYAGTGFDEMTPDGEFSMDMSAAALMDMMDSLSTGSPFVITGKLDTYDPDPGALFEFVFGLTDVVVGGGPTGFPVPKLVITTAPVPSPAGIALLGMGMLAGTRRRRE
jgi:MYXO-CTERM domain-containing protein